MADNAAAVNRQSQVILEKQPTSRAAFLFLPRLNQASAANYLRIVTLQKNRGAWFMAENSNAEENIEVPPIPKETAGAVAGAALGSMMGPAGAVVGGIVGVMAG